MSFIDFNAEEVEPNAAPEALPAGDYVAQVVGSEVKPTASGSGEYLKLEIEILSPGFSGRRVFDQLNIRNESAEAERIGRAQLSALCHAVGVLRISDSQQLHGKPFMVKLTLKEDPQYGKQNKVKGYKAATTAPQAAPIHPAASAPAAARPAAAVPPWQRQKASAS